MNSSWTGWGNASAGKAYKVGTYRIEFWYQGVCVGLKTLTIYK